MTQNAVISTVLIITLFLATKTLVIAVDVNQKHIRTEDHVSSLIN